MFDHKLKKNFATIFLQTSYYKPVIDVIQTRCKSNVQLRRIDFKPSGQKKFHITNSQTQGYVKKFLATGFEIDMP